MSSRRTRRPTRRRLTALSSAAAVVSALGLMPGAIPSASAGGHDEGPKVIATGLDNPRGLAFGEDGVLFVGEAGHAGPLCLAGPGELGPTCIGKTSKIGAVNVHTGRHHTVVGGLISIGTAVASTGVDGVSTFGNKVYGIITGSPQGVPADACVGSTVPDCAAQVAAAKAQLGDLISANQNGRHLRTLAEVGKFNYQYIVDNKATLDPVNPDFKPGDANPYGLAAVKGGALVVDAGANTLGFASRNGNVKVLRTADHKPAYFPNPPGPADQRFPYDAVPTCVALSGHSIYVGTLSGELWRYDRHRHLTMVANRDDGLTAINGCAADSRGNIIVANIFGATPTTLFAPNTGNVQRVTPSGHVKTLAKDLNFPGGVAIRHGQIYVVVNSICPKNLNLVGPDDPPFCTSTGSIIRLAS